MIIKIKKTAPRTTRDSLYICSEVIFLNCFRRILYLLRENIGFVCLFVCLYEVNVLFLLVVYSRVVGMKANVLVSLILLFVLLLLLLILLLLLLFISKGHY